MASSEKAVGLLKPAATQLLALRFLPGEDVSPISENTELRFLEPTDGKPVDSPGAPPVNSALLESRSNRSVLTRELRQTAESDTSVPPRTGCENKSDPSADDEDNGDLLPSLAHLLFLRLHLSMESGVFTTLSPVGDGVRASRRLGSISKVTRGDFWGVPTAAP